MKENKTPSKGNPTDTAEKPKQAPKKATSNIVFNIVGGTVLLLLMFGILAQLTGYMRFSESFTDEYSDNALRVANASALYIDPDELDDYLETKGDGTDYSLIQAVLNKYCESMDARFIYVIRPSEDYNSITFLVSSVQVESGFEPYDIGYVRETSSYEYKEKYQKLYDGVSDHEVVIRDDTLNPTGAHITAMIPLKNDEGIVKGILCVQRQMDALTRGRNQYMIYMLLVTAVLVIFVTVLYHLMLNNSLIRPILRITNETIRFSTKPEKAEHPLSETIKMNNEIGQLAASVDKMESNTLDYIDNLTRVTAESHRIGTELSVASRIQEGMLNTLPLHRPEFDIAAVMDPAKEVGGDFYDYFMIDDDRLCMVIADVAGKGVPAALFMAISKVILSDGAMSSKSPAEILKYANERICAKNNQDMFVTVWLAIMEISTGKIVAANAGHEFPAIYRSGGSFELFKDKHGFVIGGMSGVRYREYELTMERGDCLFVYTDGVAEATDVNNQLFGTDRMLEALNVSPDAKPEEIMTNVRKGVDIFVGEAPQFDDLTMLCMKYYGPDKKE